MENKVLSFWLSQHFPQNTAVTCAVSGGADSMAMLHVLLSLKEKLGLTVSAAHFNHRLRGAESDRDEAFVRSFCEKEGIPLTVGSADIAAIAEKTGESLEECARRERYAFLKSLGGCVTTAHTQEDSLETALLNLIRGTALKGLCGIPAQRDGILRPMLCVSHAEIRAYLKYHGIAHVEDSTNADAGCLRNRIRQDVLPLLLRENPSLLTAFSETSETLRKDEDFLSALAAQALSDAKTEDGYSCKKLSALAEPIRRRAIREVLQSRGIRKLSRKHVEAFEALLFSDNPSASLHLPDGLRAYRQYDLLLLEQEETCEELPEVPIPIGEKIEIPSFSISVYAERKTVPEAFVQTSECFAVLDGGGQIIVRSRREGDCIRLSGGTKTLKKLFIDCKIPARKRRFIPVLCQKSGVLSAFGIGVNQDFLAKPGESAVIITIKKEVKGSV